MSEQNNDLSVCVWGDFACFTRPENKMERVSYQAPTPSAARGILEAIFWKPEFRWRVTEIHVLNPIAYYSILRNEVENRASVRTAQSWAKTGGGYVASDDRSQRHTLALRDVAYTIKAQIDLKPHATAPAAKYRDQFMRRVEQGRCFARPVLGCREFAADFAPATGHERAIDRSEDLGLMLYDLAYNADGSGRGVPVFFHAQMDRGAIHVPNIKLW